MEIIISRYNELCHKQSDINEHLPTLFRYAKECSRIIECGVRGCVSSWALVHGLLENGQETRSILMNDIRECDIDAILDATSSLDIDVRYEWKSNLLIEVDEPVDLVFIDTYHVYGQLRRELAHFGPMTKKYIIMHDTTVDGITSESIRNNHDIQAKMEETGYSEEDIKEGLWRAVEEFVAQFPEWKIKERFVNNNGLTVLEKI
jgi:hypothetical protein